MVSPELPVTNRSTEAGTPSGVGLYSQVQVSTDLGVGFKKPTKTTYPDPVFVFLQSRKRLVSWCMYRTTTGVIFLIVTSDQESPYTNYKSTESAPLVDDRDGVKLSFNPVQT